MIYTAIALLTCLTEGIMMFMMFDTFNEKRQNLKPFHYIIGIFVLAGLINISNNVFNFGMLNSVMMSISIFLMSFMFKGSIRVNALIAITGYLLIVIVEVMVLFTISATFQVTVEEGVNNPSLRALGTVISKMLTFLIIRLVCSLGKKRSLYKNHSYWSFFTLTFANSVLATFLIFKFSYDSHTMNMYSMSVLCTFGLLFTTILSLSLYERTIKKAEDINKEQLLEQQVKSQKKHIDEIILAQSQLKKFKHDFSNHLISLKGYNQAGDLGGISNYISQMEENFVQNNDLFDTGNIALDSILSAKKALAESKNIEFETKFQIPENLPMDASDMCIIFGNALDNAIEACEKSETENKKISITAQYNKNTFICKITNTAPITEKTSFETTKKDKANHGFGLQNLKSALSKYTDMLELTYEKGEFVLKFIITF